MTTQATERRPAPQHIDVITRYYRRGQPHPGEIEVYSRDGGSTWRGHRHSTWHGQRSGEEYRGIRPDDLARETDGYTLVSEGIERYPA